MDIDNNVVEAKEGAGTGRREAKGAGGVEDTVTESTIKKKI